MSVLKAHPRGYAPGPSHAATSVSRTSARARPWRSGSSVCGRKKTAGNVERRFGEQINRQGALSSGHVPSSMVVFPKVKGLVP